MKRLVFLESSDIGVRYSGQAARALGFEPLFLCDLRQYQADPRSQLAEFEVLDIETSSIDRVLEALARFRGDIAAVTTFADTRLRVASEVAEILRVVGVDRSVRSLKDKSAVQRLVPEFSPETVEFALRDLSQGLAFESLQKLFRRAPSLIVKPVDAAGGLGLIHVQRVEDLPKLASHPVLAHVPTKILEGRWIAQAFIKGDLISVEGFVRAGVPRVLGISYRKKIGSTESASTFPADRALDPHARERALRGVNHLLERANFHNGYFHIEFIVDGPECVMIDANVGRIGGGAVAEQIALAYGRDPVDVFRHVLLTTLFPERSVDEVYSCPATELRETYAILYGLEKGGSLRSVRLPRDLAVRHTQVLGSGANVSPMGRDDWSWIGIISGRTLDSVRFANGIEIITDQGSFKPYY